MEVYAAMIDSMDQGVGRIVQSLKDNGQFDNTLILYLHDNGGCAEEYGRKPTKNPALGLVPMEKDELQTSMIPARSRAGHPVLSGPDVMPGSSESYIAYGKYWANVSNTPFRNFKSQNHEGGIATPLIAHWPNGITAKNKLRDQPSHLIDIMATCIEVSSATYPEKFKRKAIIPLEGKSLVESFKTNVKKDRILMWEHFGNAAIRDGKWKLVMLNGRNWELYDMETDRSELNNLAPAHPEKVKTLANLWEKNAHRTFIYPKPTGKKHM
jgi:arylsulfatase A-like enzyme